ncbi:MAG: hypothetical protein PVI43_00410 [Candidatus Bathyarchaeota archaeon]|jgi:hypothetical protein
MKECEQRDLTQCTQTECTCGLQSDSASSVDALAMPDEPIKGIKCELSGGRSISVFPADDDSFAFIFVNSGHETRIKLSAEAVQAMHSIWFELRARGLAA